MAVGVYPGSFNPPTIAHLAIAEAAVEQCELDRVDLVISRNALGKDDRAMVRVADRLAVLRLIAHTRPWLGVDVTDARLVADIADGYSVLVVGADKWEQIIDPAWYDGAEAERDAVVARLPRVAIAPRAGFADVRHPGDPVPPEATLLDVHPDNHQVSATRVRDGRTEWMLPEAMAFDKQTGAWTDPDRYDAWVAKTS